MQLEIVNVYSKGDYNKEYVWMKVLEDCNLNRYIISDRTYDKDGESNLHRHTFWFPDKVAKEGEFVALYTRSGTNIKGKAADKKTEVHRFFWKLATAVWNDDGDGASLVKIADVKTTSVKPVGS